MDSGYTDRESKTRNLGCCSAWFRVYETRKENEGV